MSIRCSGSEFRLYTYKIFLLREITHHKRRMFLIFPYIDMKLYEVDNDIVLVLTCNKVGLYVVDEVLECLLSVARGQCWNILIQRDKLRLYFKIVKYIILVKYNTEIMGFIKFFGRIRTQTGSFLCQFAAWPGWTQSFKLQPSFFNRDTFIFWLCCKLHELLSFY